jgi:hypothetical protein
LRDVTAPGAWRRGLDVPRYTAHPDVVVVHPEEGLHRANAPPAHFNEAPAEQASWQEFRDHGVSINNTLTEALRIHRGPSIRLFEVSVLSQTRGLFLIFFMLECFLILFSPVSSTVRKSWRVGLERGTTVSSS